VFHSLIYTYLLTWRALEVFGVALAAFLLGIIARYLTVIDRFTTGSKATPAERKEAHFECLRNGPDLCILGLGTFLALSAIAIRDGNRAVAAYLGTLQSAVVSVQVGFLLLSIFLTRMSDF
jgi:hypothetical protein